MTRSKYTYTCVYMYNRGPAQHFNGMLSTLLVKMTPFGMLSYDSLELSALT